MRSLDDNVSTVATTGQETAVGVLGVVVGVLETRRDEEGQIRNQV